jgi:hypothetical protein
MASTSPAAEDVPEFVQWWVRSLLDADVMGLLREVGDRPVEVRLYANKGRVRRRPALLVGVGQVDEVAAEGS